MFRGEEDSSYVMSQQIIKIEGIGTVYSRALMDRVHLERSMEDYNEIILITIQVRCENLKNGFNLQKMSHLLNFFFANLNQSFKLRFAKYYTDAQILLQGKRYYQFDKITAIYNMSDFQFYGSPGSRNDRSPPRAPHDSSPRRYDDDFYKRKAERLEEDFLTINDELNKARLRLRRAEDVEIKYDILLKQKCSVQEQTIKKQKQILELIAKNEQLNLLLKQRGAISNENRYEKQHLLKQIQLLKEKVIEAEDRARVCIAEQQNRASETIDKELLAIKRNFGEAEEQYKYQIARLTKQLQDKEQANNTTFTRHDKISKEKQSEINRLETTLKKSREDYLEMLNQKNKEIERQKEKFQHILNEGLGNIQKSMSTQDNKFKNELDGLKKIIALKNEEIQNLHNELKVALEDYSKDRDELNQQIQLLKSKIYERDRQNEQELFNMKERLTSLHAADIDAMQSHYDELVQHLKDERRELQRLMVEKDKKVEHERKQFQRGREELKLIIKNRESIIDDLKHRLTLTGDSSSNQMGNLQQTINKFANQKETITNEYKSNIAFLNQQITKLSASNELKNNEIRQLHQYNALLKKQHFENIKDLEAKWKQERKEREAEREKERDLREKVEEEYREKQKEWKNKERQLQMELEKEKREKNRWVTNNQRLEKEIQRLYKEINELQESCKTEFSKSQNIVITGGGSKRDLVNELQRQKSDFEAMKRMEIDQVKKKYELEVIRLTNLTEKLQNQLSSKKIDYQKLQDEFKKISSQYRNIQKINKDKLADYHKKMNALNSQILLTQNLYQSLVSAKSKVNKKQPEEQK